MGEKSGGQILAGELISIPLDTLRQAGPGAVMETARHARQGQAVIVDAVDWRDLEMFAAGARQALAAGKLRTV